MCGNFGLLLLLPLEQTALVSLLRRMLRITMVRGAQSAGLVTYHEKSASRYRVVNGKRTDLCDLLLDKVTQALSRTALHTGIFQGHTRFATSSICNLGGCHPHQWLPRSTRAHWRVGPDGRFVGEPRNVEGYITHNGDLDFFSING